MIPSRHIAVLVAAIAIAASTPAAADDTAAAARAYQQAQAATLAGQHGRAGELYELADQLAPSPQALRSAARARRAAGQLAAAATLAEALSARYSDDPASRALARALLDELAPQLVRARIDCAAPCRVSVDGYAAATELADSHIIYTSPGEHELAISFADGAPVDRAIHGGPGTAVAMSVDPAPAAASPLTTPMSPAPARESASSSGLSRGWFVAGTLVTVGLGGAAVWSGLDVLEQHDLYARNPTEEAFEDGRRRERRTNLLIGATALAATSTLLIAVFTDWSPDDRERRESGTRFGFAPSRGGGVITFGGEL